MWNFAAAGHRLASGIGGCMIWTFDHGVYRWRSPAGVYYRITFKGGQYHAVINRSTGFPERLKAWPTLEEAKAACIEHMRNPAGTVDRESDLRLSVR